MNNLHLFKTTHTEQHIIENIQFKVKAITVSSVMIRYQFPKSLHAVILNSIEYFDNDN